MNKHAQPLDYVIQCLENCQTPSSFDIHNAKDELKKLRLEVDNLNKALDKPVAWVRINERGDFYDPRLTLNPYINTNAVVPLYGFRKGYKDET